MENNVKVSIIVPVYNVERFLNRCVDSLVNQTLKDIEIILVDDGSKDNSPQMCDELAKQDNRIRVIHKQNQGLGMARNTGMELATGEYVVFIDSDDFIELYAYEEMYNKCKEIDADMLISDFVFYNTNSGASRKGNTTTKNAIYTESNVKQVLLQTIGYNPLKPDEDQFDCSVCKNMYKRQSIVSNNIKFCSERQYVSEDAIFNMMLIPKLNKICVVDKAYYYYCNNSVDTLTSTFKEDTMERHEILLHKKYELLKENDLFDSGKIYADSAYLGSVRGYTKGIAYANIKMKKKKEILKRILNSNTLKDILKYYPYKSTPFKQRVFTMLLKLKLVYPLLVLAKLQGLHKI